VVPDARSYSPGDEARLLVLSPWPDAHGLLTVTVNGTSSSTAFEV
jgi:hypothetical protein